MHQRSTIKDVRKIGVTLREKSIIAGHIEKQDGQLKQVRKKTVIQLS